MKTPTKDTYLAALSAFVNQRSGIEFVNYSSGNWAESRRAFMGDYRPILKHGQHARQMLALVRALPISAADLVKASEGAFSGRLIFKVKGDKIGVDYCTGQYFPTEYRNAACAVLAAALWNHYRANCSPRGNESLGDAIRYTARHELGRGIAAKWFN